jgi:predicted nucleotidyltransferase
MFTGEVRERVRQRLLGLAEADAAICGAAITGSHAAGGGDEWSDIDLAFAVDGPLGPVMERWTERLNREFGAVHHWDLPAGRAVYRVFLLPGWLEVDIAFVPEAEFGPLGPHWSTVFGTAVPLEGPVPPVPPVPPDVRSLAGRAWHHALHARASIARGRDWQAEHWISAIRDQVIALACVRLGYPASYAKGAHLLPPEVTTPLADSLVCSLGPAELRRALAAAIGSLATELGRTDETLAARLNPMLAELGRPS